MTLNSYLTLSYYGNSYDTTTAINDGTWKFIAITYDGSSLLQYVNATLAKTSTSVTLATTLSHGDIGRSRSSTTGYYSDFRVYNRALTSTEISTIYANDITTAKTYKTATSATAQNLGSRLATTPVIAAGTGAGSAPTISVAGSDSSFQVTLATGSSPSGSNAVIATVTFASAFPNTPYASVTPGNANAAALSGTTGTYEVSSVNTFVLYSGTAALTGATTYVWNVHVL